MKTKLIGLMVVLVLLLGSYGSVSAAPVDDEFRVNTHTIRNQRFPAVAMAASGNFVITWDSQPAGSEYDVRAQRYDRRGNRLGSEFQVNTYTANHQWASAVAMAASGNFVITWASYQQDGSYWGVYAQRYDRRGNRLGSEFQVNTCTDYSQSAPAAAMDASGNFVITWNSDGQDSSGRGVYAQRYDRTGNALGSEFQVNTCTDYSQSAPAAAMDASGNFVITWNSDWQDGSNYGVYAQRYDRMGNPLGSEFRVNTYTNSHQRQPAAAMAASGNFVITWHSDLQDGSGWGIYAQRYDRMGNPLGSEFQVNTWTSDHQFASAAAMAASGNFVITWNSHKQVGGRYDIYAQRYDRTVTP